MLCHGEIATIYFSFENLISVLIFLILTCQKKISSLSLQEWTTWTYGIEWDLLDSLLLFQINVSLSLKRWLRWADSSQYFSLKDVLDPPFSAILSLPEHMKTIFFGDDIDFHLNNFICIYIFFCYVYEEYSFPCLFHYTKHVKHV